MTTPHLYPTRLGKKTKEKRRTAKGFGTSYNQLFYLLVWVYFFAKVSRPFFLKIKRNPRAVSSQLMLLRLILNSFG